MEELLSGCRRAYDEFLYLLPLDTLAWTASELEICRDSKALSVVSHKGMTNIIGRPNFIVYCFPTEIELVSDDEITEANHHKVRKMLVGFIDEECSLVKWKEDVYNLSHEYLCSEVEIKMQILIDFIGAHHKVTQRRDSFLYVSDETVNFVLKFYENQIDYYKQIIEVMRKMLEVKKSNDE